MKRLLSTNNTVGKAAIVSVVGLAIIAFLFFQGILHINNPSKSQYPVRGVDVSSYQGDIDWDVLSQQGISFAFIKAAEGSSSTDEFFAYNWKSAATTPLRIGAYHFFSFESAGESQAKNFCSIVSPVEDMLPPVVDVEPYGEYNKLDITMQEQLTNELADWLQVVEETYGMKPIIYTTQDYYATWIRDSFPDYDIWIRSVYGPVSNTVDWTFWQYSSRTHLQGYDGDEYFIDMNLFNGSAEEFATYGHTQR